MARGEVRKGRDLLSISTAAEAILKETRRGHGMIAMAVILLLAA